MLKSIISQKILVKAKIINFFYISLFLVIGIFLCPKTSLATTITADNIINLTNTERLNANVNALIPSPPLNQAAYNKGQDIIKAQVFQHNINNKKFSTWIKDAGYEYSYAGENLALDFETSEGVIKAWLDSDTHRKNLLNTNFQEIGVAIIRDKFQGNETILVVQTFGSPVYASTNETNSSVSTFKNNYQNAVKSANNPITAVSVLTSFGISHEQLPENNFNELYPLATKMMPSLVLSDIYTRSALNSNQLRQATNHPNQFLVTNYQQKNQAAMTRSLFNFNWSNFNNYLSKDYWTGGLANYYLFITLATGLLLFIYFYFNIVFTKKNKLK